MSPKTREPGQRGLGQPKREPRVRVGPKGGETWEGWGQGRFQEATGTWAGGSPHLEGCLQLQKNGLAQENLPGFEAQTTDLVLRQLYILSRPGALHWGRKEASGPWFLRQEEVNVTGGPKGTSG